MKVGFIGVGQMGVHMARNIAEAGYDLVVNDARREAAETLLERGAEWADSPAEVAEACRMVISCLPSPQSVEEIALGASGLTRSWRTGDIYIDMSTNSPSMVRSIAAKAAAQGVAVLDAPVSGGTKGAEAGTLTIMVGGDAAALEKARPVLEPMANRIFHVGDVGCGNVAKLVNNMIGLACNSICAEGLVLGARAGIDPQVLFDLLERQHREQLEPPAVPQDGVQGRLRPGVQDKPGPQRHPARAGAGRGVWGAAPDSAGGRGGPRRRRDRGSGRQGSGRGDPAPGGSGGRQGACARE